MEEGTAIQDHINAFNQLVCQLMNIDEEIKEEEHALLLLSSLPKSYKPLVQMIITGKQTLKFDDVTTLLRENEIMMGKKSVSNGGESALAFESSNRERNEASRNGKKTNSLVVVYDEDVVLLMQSTCTDASNTWVLDSAASMHVGNKKNYINTLKTYEEFDDVIVGNNKKMKVEGVESVRLKLHTGKNSWKSFRCEEDRSLTSDELVERKKLQSCYTSIIQEEEAYWSQRSRIQWLKEGDANTSFFHRTASVHKKSNYIVSINHLGSEIYEQEEISKAFHDYYSNLFGQANNSNMTVNWECLYPDQLPSLSSLEDTFSETEIKHVVFSMNPNKSPGPDGFSFLFYQTFWELIKSDLVDIMNFFGQHPSSLQRVNKVLITLIPKTTSSPTARDYRPISLINCIFKIFTKILANRLAPIMKDLVAPTQSAFQEGKSTLDSVLIANEMIHFCSKKKKEVAMFKIDFAKAFDSISWSFLINLLKARGFGEKWCSWIYHIISSSNCAVLVNGSPSKFFKCHRGLKQGDPLSPLLFNISADVLNDNLIFVKSTYKDISVLKTLLYIFEDIFGLAINYYKSSLIYFGNILNRGSCLASALNCKLDKLPIKYLGLPLKGGKLAKSDWQPMLDNLNRKLASWKRNCLSFGGRLILLNSVLSTSPLYYMSFHKLPGWLIKEVDKIRKNFLWTGNNQSKPFKCLVNWKRKGFFLQLSNSNSQNSMVWNDIISNKEAFLHLISWSLGIGTNIRFWEDKWIGNNTLSSLYPAIYSLALSSNVSIHSQGLFLNNTWHWHPILRRSISLVTNLAKSDLIHLLGSFKVNNEVDVPKWSFTSNGCFSVKSFYDFLNTRCVMFAFHKVVWNPILPSKVQIFSWFLSMNRLHTKDNLIKKGWQGDSLCIFCGIQPETCNHIFFSCSTAKKVWKHFSDYCIPFVWASSLDGLLSSVESLHNEKGVIWRSIFSAVCWFIWSSRNKVIFEHLSFSVHSIINSTIAALCEWAGSASKKNALKLARALEENPIRRSSV
ncbi:uncharacterized protein LOC109838550 [Asparagus officinalis]|uniref:uncharacterized protein LOC109838550 n=1 Tax=Asparagus officinalis TaxID=4686 RepID=UPI00098E4B36|nr:uncharacterized protein LOC109838550 [Asparagus officinalis]